MQVLVRHGFGDAVRRLHLRRYLNVGRRIFFWRKDPEPGPEKNHRRAAAISPRGSRADVREVRPGRQHPAGRAAQRADPRTREAPRDRPAVPAGRIGRRRGGGAGEAGRGGVPRVRPGPGRGGVARSGPPGRRSGRFAAGGEGPAAGREGGDGAGREPDVRPRVAGRAPAAGVAGVRPDGAGAALRPHDQAGGRLHPRGRQRRRSRPAVRAGPPGPRRAGGVRRPHDGSRPHDRMAGRGCPPTTPRRSGRRGWTRP